MFRIDELYLNTFGISEECLLLFTNKPLRGDGHLLLTAQITEPPISGTYPEKIFDAPFSTEDWTWVKFEDEAYDAFYGQFRGKPKNVALSTENNFCYVLTDTFLYELNREVPSDFQVRDFWDAGHTIRNVTFSPDGKPLLSDYYTIFTIKQPIHKLSGELVDALIEIENPFPVDYIAFDNWEGHLLHISAQTLVEGLPLKLIYDTTTGHFSENNNK